MSDELLTSSPGAKYLAIGPVIACDWVRPDGSAYWGLACGTTPSQCDRWFDVADTVEEVKSKAAEHLKAVHRWQSSRIADEIEKQQ